jgi:hypothetical protein
VATLSASNTTLIGVLSAMNNIYRTKIETV